MDWMAEALGFIGLAILTAGLAMVSWPIALIVLGSLLIVAAIRIETNAAIQRRGNRDNRPVSTA